MNRLLGPLTFVLTIVPFLSPARADEPRPNALTPKEIAEGWILLFDGATTFGWKIEGEAKVENGELLLGGGKATTATPTTKFGAFELHLESKQMEGTQPPKVVLDPKEFKGGFTDELSPDKARWSVYKLIPGPVPGPMGPVFEVPAGSRVALRDIKLHPIRLISIFNGKDLTGWKEVKTTRTKSQFSVTDKGELNIKNGPGDLQTLNQWDDFVLQIEVYSNGAHLNSGVFFRCLPGEFWSGYEAQIRNQWKGDDRTQAVDYGTGGIYNRQPARKVVSGDHEWFTMTVVARGTHLAVWVNGFQTADFTDTRPADKSARKGSKTGAGPISLQGHDPTTDLSFRNIRIAHLPK